MPKVTIEFTGEQAGDAAQKLYTWIVDGGLSDGIMDECAPEGHELDLSDWQNDTLSMTFTVAKSSSE